MDASRSTSCQTSSGASRAVIRSTSVTRASRTWSSTSVGDPLWVLARYTERACHVLYGRSSRTRRAAAPFAGSTGVHRGPGCAAPGGLSGSEEPLTAHAGALGTSCIRDAHRYDTASRRPWDASDCPCICRISITQGKKGPISRPGGSRLRAAPPPIAFRQCLGRGGPQVRCRSKDRVDAKEPGGDQST